jgi:hypothetical protein
MSAKQTKYQNQFAKTLQEILDLANKPYTFAHTRVWAEAVVGFAHIMEIQRDKTFDNVYCHSAASKLNGFFRDFPQFNQADLIKWIHLANKFTQHWDNLFPPPPSEQPELVASDLQRSSSEKVHSRSAHSRSADDLIEPAPLQRSAPFTLSKLSSRDKLKRALSTRRISYTRTRPKLNS